MIKNKVDTVSETLNNGHVWGYLIHVLDPKLHTPGVKTLEWDPRIKRRINMGIGEVYSTQVGLALNLVNGSISPQFHIKLLIYSLLL